MFEQIGQDLRYASRTLFRYRGFSAAAALTLALAIGMSTAIFSIVYGVLLRPLPFSEPSELVSLHTVMEREAQSTADLSPPNFASLREDAKHAFEGLASYVEGEHTLVGAGEPRKLESATVSAGFFEILGIRPALGRGFDATENQPGQEQVVVIDQTLWQQGFGGDRNVLGRSVSLDGVPHTVIGVMPAGFDFPNKRQLWVPQTYGPTWSAGTSEGRKRNTIVPVLGRLREGVAIEAAQAELATIAHRLAARFPDSNSGVSFTARPLRAMFVGDVQTPLLVLLGAVGFVLIIACANVAGLLLARTERRRQEIAVRVALGAGRARIVRQLVTEAVVLGLAGGVLGLFLAVWATNRLVAAQPSGIPRLDAIHVDGPIWAFGFAVAMLSGVITGLIPAFRATGSAVGERLKSAGRSVLASKQGQRLRSVLVVCQVALAVVLLIGASLLLESFVRLTSVDPGFRAAQVLSFALELPQVPYGPARSREFYDTLLTRIGQRPNVRSTGLVFRLPVEQSTFNSRFRIDGKELPNGETPRIGVQVVSPGYLQTMGIGIRRGRGLADTDGPESQRVVVLNESAVKRFFPGEDPIGRRLVGFSYDPVEQAADAFTIVGVVSDVLTSGLKEAPEPEAFFAHAQVPLPRMHVLVRTAGDPLAMTADVRRAISGLDPNLALPEFRTVEQVVSASLSRPRLLTTVLAVLSAVSVVLAMVGIYGLVSYSVAQRTREIGIRVALGASPGMLIKSIVRGALILAGIGLAIGLGGAFALTRFLESQLFGVTPTEPTALLAVSVLLVTTALVASIVPAWRAASLDPLVALRTE